MEHYRPWHTLKLESLIFQKHIAEKHSTTNSGGLPSQMAQITKHVMVYKHQEVTLSQDQGQGHKKRKFAIHSGKKTRKGLLFLQEAHMLTGQQL